MPIGTISFDIGSSSFLKELVKRQIDFVQRPTVAYKIVVPEDLKWWYWLEFGTAGRQDADAPHKTTHSGTYPIDPVNAKMLRIPDARDPSSSDGARFLFHVDHPGIRPRLIYRGVRAEILDFAKQVIAGSLAGGVRVASFEFVLRDQIMPFALKRMGERLEEQAPGVKERGNNPFGK
jgi:hypothetical protein